MLGNVIMVMSAVMQLTTPVQMINTALPLGNDIASSVITISTADHSRLVSNADIINLPFVEQYFRSDRNLPFSITISTADDPVIPGTRIPVYRIAALFNAGSDIDSLMRDYPSLTNTQIADTLAFAKANPYKGKTQYPTRSLKSALREMDFHIYLNLK